MTKVILSVQEEPRTELVVEVHKQTKEREEQRDDDEWEAEGRRAGSRAGSSQSAEGEEEEEEEDTLFFIKQLLVARQRPVGSEHGDDGVS